MLSQINIGGLLEPKNFFVSFGKTIYIMTEFIIETFTLKIYASYLLIGTIVGFLLEKVIRSKTGYDITGWERASLICGWPVHVTIFVWNFIKGYLGKD